MISTFFFQTFFYLCIRISPVISWIPTISFPYSYHLHHQVPSSPSLLRVTLFSPRLPFVVPSLSSFVFTPTVRFPSVVLSSSVHDDTDLDDGYSVTGNDTISTTTTTTATSTSQYHPNQRASAFNLTTALLCGGLAFDSYLEPPANSTRWERGSKGLHVAFVSSAYTRQLYKGLIEVTIQRMSGLPQETESGTAEWLLSGNGIDACLLVAVLEGLWKEDLQKLEEEQYHTGVLDLSGAAQIARSTTCWSSLDEEKAKASQKRNGKALPYYIPGASFPFGGKGAQAVWPAEEPPLYLYVQDPSTAQIVLTVIDDDKLGQGRAVGSTYKSLKEIIPQATLSQKELVERMKQTVVKELQQTDGTLDRLDDVMKLQLGAATSWQGSLPLTSKPRKQDKKGQMFMAAAAGAALAGPMGAAAGAVAASFYEGQIQGEIQCQIRYLPIPMVPMERKTYTVYGGMPGIDWGSLYQRYMAKQTQFESETPHTREESAHNNMPLTMSNDTENISRSIGNDLEHCFFVSHQQTGGTCAVYRSVARKLIIVSFRGTCTPIDLITDASLVQDAWVEGEDIDNQLIVKVHAGFRTSLNSIARRLKTLILATPAPGDDIADYNMLVTGHSLGGALATLFTADIGQYGIDAGRALPQLEPSEPWWKGVLNVLTGQQEEMIESGLKEPPRPKTLSLYNFGSPRVGNVAFSELFDALICEGLITQAYRIVNGDDVVARLPRTFNAFVFGNINYDHVGKTVLISQPEKEEGTRLGEDGTGTPAAPGKTSNEPKVLLWVEGESDNKRCPVRDGMSLSSPTAEGSLLNDLLSATRESFSAEASILEKDVSLAEKIMAAAGKVSERMKNLKPSDVASVLGIDREYTERELRMIQSIVQGKALAHHLEDEYYSGMGRACGFLARVGEDLIEFEG